MELKILIVKHRYQIQQLHCIVSHLFLKQRIIPTTKQQFPNFHQLNDVQVIRLQVKQLNRNYILEVYVAFRISAIL
jgi:hypothetical protein